MDRARGNRGEARGARIQARERGPAGNVDQPRHPSFDGAQRLARIASAGESRVRAEFPAATILRPSVMFGPGDSFFSALARVTRFMPVIPLFGAGATRLQPVYVGDVAEAVAKASGLLQHEIDAPITQAQVALMKIDNLVDPKHATFQDLGIKPRSIEEIVPAYL